MNAHRSARERQQAQAHVYFQPLTGRLISIEVGKVVGQFTLAGLDLLRQQILLIQKQDHGDRTQPPTQMLAGVGEGGT